MTLPSQTYAALTGAGDDAAIEPRETRNGFIHIISLSLTKSADGLIDPKLVLSWALNALGAPAAMIGLLVPIRESGALLPQLALAQKVEAADTRGHFWAFGSLVQGIAALGIAASIGFLDGLAAGIGVVVCLAILACARAISSVSYKDALARSIPKTRRGAVTGTAGTVASTAVLLFGALLALNILPLSTETIAWAVTLAAGFWLAAAAIFTRLSERSMNDGEPEAPSLSRLIEPILEDEQLRRFVLARALLVATALAPPFILLASAQDGENALGQLGPLVLASAFASIASSYVWGRLSDHSSRLTLAASAAMATVILGIAALIALATGGLFGVWGTAAIIFLAQIAYQGVRAGRSLHLTDMATDDQRARYTALSNTLIGIVLLVGAGLGPLADWTSPAIVLVNLAALCALAFPVAMSLDEVQGRDA